MDGISEFDGANSQTHNPVLNCSSCSDLLGLTGRIPPPSVEIRINRHHQQHDLFIAALYAPSDHIAHTCFSGSSFKESVFKEGEKTQNKTAALIWSDDHLRYGTRGVLGEDWVLHNAEGLTVVPSLTCFQCIV